MLELHHVVPKCRSSRPNRTLQVCYPSAATDRSVSQPCCDCAAKACAGSWTYVRLSVSTHVRIGAVGVNSEP